MRDPGNETIEQMLERCRVAGGPDDRAMAELGRVLECYRPAIYRKCLATTGSRERAEELCQDTMEKAMMALPTYRGDAKFKSWIYGITVNLCRNASRKYTDLLTADGILEAESAESTVVKALSKHERLELLRRVREEVLTVEEQRVVWLRYELQLPIAQINEQMQLTGSGARGVLQTCKRRMRVAIRARLEEMGHGSSFLRTS